MTVIAVAGACRACWAIQAGAAKRRWRSTALSWFKCRERKTSRLKPRNRKQAAMDAEDIYMCAPGGDGRSWRVPPFGRERRNHNENDRDTRTDDVARRLRGG